MKARWYLGGFGSNKTSASDAYTYERGTTVIQNTTDGVTRTTTWDGLIDLIYTSDYGFAAKDNGTNNCSSNMNASYNCSPKYNWLNKQSCQSFITRGVYFTFDVTSMCHNNDETNNGTLQHDRTSSSFIVRSTLYLTSNTLITGGTGLSTNPYTISLSN